MSQIFLAVIGAAYLALAVWCAINPPSTAAAIGFHLRPGTGQSEYFTIYGGLQLALGLVFLLPLVKADALPTVLLACVLIHGALVLFRSLAFFLYSDIGSIVYALAASEWIIFLGSLALWWRS